MRLIQIMAASLAITLLMAQALVACSDGGRASDPRENVVTKPVKRT